MIVNRILNSNKIKYDILKPLVKNYVTDMNIINIHIDLHSIIADLYREDILDEIGQKYDDESRAVSSCIINIIAHYRHFFSSRFNKKTNFYLYFSKKRPKNNTLENSQYGVKYFDKYHQQSSGNNNIMDNLELVSIIIKYIPQAYYIDCGDIESIVACSNIIENNKGKDIMQFIISKDFMWYQLLNFTKHSMILRLKRDDSYIITSKNLYSILLSKAKYQVEDLTPELLSAIYAISGMPSRDLKGIKKFGINNSIKLLDKAVQKELILNEYYPKIGDILDEIYKGDEKEKIKKNFKAIDLSYQYKALSYAQKEKIDNQLEDKYSKKGLLECNTLYYTGEYSLMIEELMEVGKDVRRPIKW